MARLSGLIDSISSDKKIYVGYMEYGCQCFQHPEILPYAEKVNRNVFCDLCGAEVSSSLINIMFAQAQNVSPEIASRSILIQMAHKKEAGNVFRLVAVSIDPQNLKDQHYQILVCESCMKEQNKKYREGQEKQRAKINNDGKCI